MTHGARRGAPGAAARRHLSPFPETLGMSRAAQGFPFWGNEESAAWRPPVDIYEAIDEIVVTLEIAGVRKEDVQVELSENTLTISGERRLDHEDQRDGYHRVERRYGRFARSFTVPANIDRDGLRAEYRDGLLRVRLPKRTEARPRTIAVE